MMPLPPSMRAEDHLPLGAPERLKVVPAAPKPPCKHQWLAMPDSKTHSRCADCGTVTLTEMVAPKPPPAPVPSAQCQEEDDDALGVCIKPVTIGFDLASSSGVMSLFTTSPTSDFERLMREATVQAVPWPTFDPNTYTAKPAPKPFPETTPYTFTPRGYLNPKHGRAPADTRVDLYFMDGSTTEDFNSNFVNWSPDLGPRTVIGWRRTTVWQKHDGSDTRPAGVDYTERVRVRLPGVELTVPASCFWADITEWRRLAP